MPLGGTGVALSTVPALLDALLANVSAALGPDVLVIDGQPVGDLADDVVCIAFTGNPGEASVRSVQSRSGLASPDAESYDVLCLASSWMGSQDDVQAVRDRAYELIAAVARDLARDPSVGGVVARAQMRTGAFAQEQTDTGPTATVLFAVHVDAFTRQV